MSPSTSPKPHDGQIEHMRVSVIIPNLNSPIVDRTIQALQSQIRINVSVEVIVVGRDEPALVQRTDTIKFIDTGQPVSPAIARNIGVEHAQGDVLCFLDADCVPAADWLACLLAAYQDRDVWVVGGSVVFPVSNYWTIADNIATFYPFLLSAPAGERELLPSLNLSFRRPVWDRVGGFDERYPYPAGEDADWTTRARLAGYRLHFEPRAVVYHYPARTSVPQLWRHALTFGKYSIKVDPRHWPHLGRPIVFRHWTLVSAGAPLIAAWVTARIFWRNPTLWRRLHTAPAIWLAKVAWCVGVAQRLRDAGGQWPEGEPGVFE